MLSFNRNNCILYSVQKAAMVCAAVSKYSILSAFGKRYFNIISGAYLPYGMALHTTDRESTGAVCKENLDDCCRVPADRNAGCIKICEFWH